MGKIAGLDVRIPSSVMAHLLQAMASLRSEREVHTKDTLDKVKEVKGSHQHYFFLIPDLQF